MSNQHIENLEIRNFKCFKQLSIANIGQVNLIGGKNNVGKTAFLEAVYIFFFPDTAYDLAGCIKNIIQRRQVNNIQQQFEIDFIYDDESKVSISSLSKFCTIEHSVGVINDFILPTNNFPVEIMKLSVNDDNKDISIRSIFNFQDFNNPRIKEQIIYIPSTATNENTLAILIGHLINLGIEDFLNNSLSLFDKNIVEIKAIPISNAVTLKLKLKNKKSLVLLSSLGEGINRYIAILCAIWASKDGVLLIDEIENGIHYMNYKKLWEIIFKASIEANCQIFITTHSKECITAFNDVQFEDKECNAQYFEFYKNLKTDLITASARDKEQLRYALTHEGRIRGE